ncbi:MAG: invasion associated locus B family protein [Rhodobacteraceae bacterium]|nr:MAG: invasion associated locus B family protein [Paracoccaceae bacterium]
MTQDKMTSVRATGLAAVLALLGSAVIAQTSPSTDSPVTALSTGEIIGEEANGDSYVGNTHGDWEMVCVRVPDEEDPCQMYQLLRDAEGNATAEVSLFPLPAGQEAAAGATILTPLETLLTAQLVLQIDGGPAKRYPFTFCTAIGCIARVGFTAEEVDAFRRGAAATWTLVPVAAPDQTVELTMSLMGFTAAFEEASAQLEQ